MGGTCATRVTRATIDFQERDGFELRDEEGARACCKDESFATRMEQEGGTCATRVTRGTFDFQARDSFELRVGNFGDDSLGLRAWEYMI